MSYKCVCAVDPGLTGAVAFYFPATDNVSAFDMPVAGGNVDCSTFNAMLEQWRPDVSCVEQVASRPGQGVSSMFKFGCGYGMVQGVIQARSIPLHLVTPQRWKKHFRLDSDKEKSRALALRFWPARSDLFGRKKDNGRAEAALLAKFAAQMIV